MWMAFIGPAAACGGFFCSGGGYTTEVETGSYTTPVLQSSERILFQVNPDDTVTTYVEVAYERSADVDFGWIIPIPAPIDAATVEISSAELFNGLDAVTAPRFVFEWTERTFIGTGGYSGYYGDGGCGCGWGCATLTTKSSGGYTSSTTTTTEEITIEVVSESVVGPFEIEVITAADAEEFALWLDANGYDLPPGAVDPLSHYIDGGMAFLGVKLAPDVPDGPIDTLVFTYPATEPMIPVILTAVASTSTLPILTYVLSDEPFAPRDWEQLALPVEDVLPNGLGGTTYFDVFEAELPLDGQAFALEYASRTVWIDAQPAPELEALVRQRAWLTRWRGQLTPEQMVDDPVFSAQPDLAEYGNVHTVVLPYGRGETPTSRRGGGGAWLWPVMGLAVLARRLRRA